MNGLIRGRLGRFSPRSLTSSIAGGVCLFLGFVVGAKVVPASPIFELPPQLKSRTIDFTKISWISHEFEGKTIALATQDPDLKNETLDVQLTFSSFELPKPKMPVKHFAITKHKAKKLAHKALVHSHIIKMVRASAEEATEETIEDSKQDFRSAMKAMKESFFSAVYLKPMTTEEKVAMKLEEPAVVVSPIQPLPVLKKTKVTVKKSVKRSVAKKPSPVVATKIAKIETLAAPEMVAEVTDVQYPQNPSPEQPVVLSTQPERVSIQTTRASAEANIDTIQTLPEAPKVEAPKASATEMAAEEAEVNMDVLKDAMLNAQLKRQLAANPAPPPSKPHPERVVQKKDNNMPEPEETPFLPDDGDHAKYGLTSCNILNSHIFFRPGTTETTQICPQHKTWLSKESLGLKDNQGWVKLDTENSFPTLTRHPAPNGGPTLLLDSNSVALLAIKSGVRVVKGTGIVAGVLPAGLKVEIRTRGEEAEYFELNGKRYFAFLNAEPGAGVIQVSEEKEQNGTSSVFAPVLPDTITYLDLAKPESRNILVQVVKSNKPSDPDISGLRVMLSTNSEIKAITQTQGHAALREVSVVPGFPVFVDVESKEGSEQRSTYRYELKHMNQYGVYVLNQVTNRNLLKWVGQIPHGVSDQSGFVLGSVNPKILNGFKNYYYPRMVPLSERFGMTPQVYSVLWDGKLSERDPLEGDRPRFFGVQIPEGIAQIKLMNEFNQEIYSNILPVSPRVINVVSE